MAVVVAVPGPNSCLALGIVWIPIGIAVVLLRFLARHRRRAPLLADDWLIIPSAVSRASFRIGMKVTESCRY